MKNSTKHLGILFWLFLCAPLAAGGEKALSAEYPELYRDLTEMTPDPSRVAVVKELEISREQGVFHLKEGTFYLAAPVRGRVAAALFEGQGQFRYSPPGEIEKAHLARFFGESSLKSDFNTLVLFFTDSTFDELTAKLNFGPGRPGRQQRENLHYAIRYLSEKEGKWFEPTLIGDFLNGAASGFFHAHFSRTKTQPLFFQIDPAVFEPVRFMRRLKGGSYQYIPEVINQYAASAMRPEGAPNPAALPFSVRDYRLDVQLSGSDLDFHATAEMTLDIHKPGQRWLRFDLFRELEADSLFWEGDSAAAFFREKENPHLWVKGAGELATDRPYRLRVHYHGRLVERFRDIFLVRDPHRWYPFTGSRIRADFDLTFTYPRGMDLAGIGEVVERDTLEARVRERRVTREAAPLATFNIGFFDTLAVSRNGLPEIVVQTYAPEVRRNSPLGKREEPGDARNVKAQVAEDVAASLAFFQDKMGPLPLRRLLVSEIPYRHGAAFPGLLLLSWMTFEMTGTKGIDEAFRAHEVAHQYWGIGVDARSYHDAWLSEGMAEFWGWQVARRRLLEKDPPNGEKRYRDFLKDWRENIIENRRFLFGDGQEAAPIWLGHRTHSTETEGDYTLIIYKKGAWVLNMLETLWQLKDTPGPDFEAFLGEFYRRHRGGRVTTEQFIAAAEAAYGDSLQWFFDQWVYGTDLPLYRLSGDIRNGGEGRFTVQLKIEGEGISPDFRMPLPVTVEFGDGSEKTEYLWIGSQPLETELGPYDTKPQKIRLNKYEKILCEVKD